MAHTEVNIYLGASSMRTCLGNKSETIAAMRSGSTGLKYSEEFAMPIGRATVEPIAEFSRFESLLVEQLQNVIKESGVDLSSTDTQLIISTTKGNIDYLANDCENLDERTFIDASVEVVADYLHCYNKPIVISNACISGVSAFVVARWLMISGSCKNVIVAG